jgi:hypothetical protein
MAVFESYNLPNLKKVLHVGLNLLEGGYQKETRQKVLFAKFCSKKRKLSQLAPGQNTNHHQLAPRNDCSHL